MNKTLIIALLVFMMSNEAINAQDGRRERIMAYKTAYITQELDLSAAEAEKFWPVYNDYDKKLFSLKVERGRKERARIKEMGGPDKLNDAEAIKILNKMLSNEKEAASTREKMYKDLENILSPRKLLKLYHAEGSFNKRLLSEFRKGRGGQK